MKLLPGSLAQIKGYWTAHVVLFLALALTSAGYIGHSRYMTTREQARFAQGVPEVLEQTRARLGIYLAMMKGARALFSAVDRMTPDKLARYFEVLKVHDAELNRGMDGMGVIWKVPPGLRDAHEKELRLKYPHYTISREHPEETIYPIIHFEATGTNASRALGWNVAEDQLRREVIQQAERTREPAISPRTELFYPDGSRGTAGFVMYLPFLTPPPPRPVRLRL